MGYLGFPGKEFAYNEGDSSSIPGLGRSTGEGIGCSLQYSWTSVVAQMVKNLPGMQETWVRSLGWEGKISWRKESLPTPVFWPGQFHGVTNSWRQLSNFYFHFHGVSKIIKLVEAEGSMVVVWGSVEGETGELGSFGYVRWVSCGGLLSSMVL